jgi:hypothetical protein
MRAVILAFACGAALAATSAQAAPVSGRSTPVELGAAPSLELVRDGCGRGSHRTRWRDQWGYWHWGNCAPDEGPYGGRDAGWYYPPSYWRGAPPPWGWGNP